MILSDRILNRVIDLARRTPYFHLYHADGTIYMERYWIVPDLAHRTSSETPFLVRLLQWFGVAIRLHCIHSPDLDREMHDHPWTFLSRVLRGWYVEVRPVYPERVDFDKFQEIMTEDEMREKYPRTHPSILAVSSECKEVIVEPVIATCRECGSWALRRFYHRHKIIEVSPGGVWTLFITFRKRQAWGFYTPTGKIWWWKFDSVHNNRPLP